MKQCNDVVSLTVISSRSRVRENGTSRTIAIMGLNTLRSLRAARQTKFPTLTRLQYDFNAFHSYSIHIIYSMQLRAVSRFIIIENTIYIYYILCECELRSYQTCRLLCVVCIRACVCDIRPMSM